MTSKEAYQPHKIEPHFYYGYVVVVAAFIIMVVSWGLYIVFGLFFNPLLEEFKWTRAATSGAYSLSSVIQGLLGIAMGGLTDRFGPRIVVISCGVFLGLGYLLMSKVETVWQLYLFYGVLVGIGMSGLWIPLLSSVARWFVKRRSMMTGIVVSGLTIGQFIAPPLINRLISQYGWRQSYIILGSIVTLSIVLAAWFLKRDPKQTGQNDSKIKERENLLEPDAKSYSFKEALHTKQFWLVSSIFFCVGYSAFAVTVHIVPHVTALGISDVTAANILAVNGGIGIIGNFVLGGLLGDIIGNRKAFIIGLILMTAALIWLVPAREIWTFYLCAVILGLALGSMGTSESPMIARLFWVELTRSDLRRSSSCLDSWWCFRPLPDRLYLRRNRQLSIGLSGLCSFRIYWSYTYNDAETH